MPRLQPTSRAAQAALLTWVNTFDLDRRVNSWEDLVDGHVFAQMLQDLDPDYDPSELGQNTASSSWLKKKQNIQSVFKALTKYIIHKDKGGQIEFLPRTIDIRSVSDDLDEEGITQLICVFAAAAMMGDKNTKYIPMMADKLSTTEQHEIMMLLQRKADEKERLGTVGADGGVKEGSRGLDAGLGMEAEMATFAAEQDRLNKKLADSNTRLEHLQISYERIKEELERTQRNLESEKQKHGANESQIIQGLYDKIREQDELISNQEAQAEDDRMSKQRLNQENSQLSKKADLTQQLQDEVQELRHANEELTKKANTVDRFKQKLESQRGMEGDLQNALYELSQTKESLRDYENVKSRSSQQATTIERFRTMVAQLEQELEDNRVKRMALDSEILSTKSQLDRLLESKVLDEARIAELEQQILHGGADVPVSSPDAGKTAFSLEEELQHEADPKAAYSIEISRLRAENNLLRNNMGVGSENERLRNELELSKQRELMLQEKFNVVFEKHTVAQEQIQALLDSSAGEGNAALMSLRKSFQDASSELSQQKLRATELENQLADRNREVMGLKTDLSAVSKGSREALEDLKSTDKLISASLQKELEALRNDNKKLQVDLDQQKTQLVDALLSKDKLRKDMDEAVREQPPIQSPTTDSGSTVDQAVVDELVQKSNEKIGKLRGRVKQQVDVSEPVYDLTMISGGPLMRVPPPPEALVYTKQKDNKCCNHGAARPTLALTSWWWWTTSTLPVVVVSSKAISR
jgi:protein HOOK3